MLHDPALARAIVPDVAPRSLGAIALKVAFGAHDSFEGYVTGLALRAALVAFALVPGRYLIAMMWRAVAPTLGLGS
jgi:hypothetical protein